MQPSPLSSTQPSHNSTQEPQEQTPRRRHTSFAIAFLLISLAGFIDATYLAIKKLTGSTVTCSLVGGCDTVTSSVYSEIAGIPVALLGAVFYLGILLLSILYLDKKRPQTLRLLAKLTWIGLFASLYFMFVQAILLKAYCIYCIGSAVSSSLLFILGMVYLKTHPPQASLDVSKRAA